MCIDGSMNQRNEGNNEGSVNKNTGATTGIGAGQKRRWNKSAKEFLHSAVVLVVVVK